MEQAHGGSAERELATPETASQEEERRSPEEGPRRQGREEVPSAKEFDTETDEELPPDQEAMQPDSS